jgi:hypothetical protein
MKELGASIWIVEKVEKADAAALDIVSSCRQDQP